MTLEINSVKKILGFDMDGVIVDHTDAKIKLAGELGFVLRPEETASDTIKNIIPKETLHKIQKGLYDVLNNQPLMAGAKEILFKIKKSNISFYLISRRREGPARERATEILQSRGLWPEIFDDKNIFFVSSPEEKNVVAAKLGITHYVDDEEKVLDKISCVKNRIILDIYNFKKRNAL